MSKSKIQECSFAGSFFRKAIFTDSYWDWNYIDAVFHETLLPNEDIETCNYKPSELMLSLQKKYDEGQRIFRFGCLENTVEITGDIIEGTGEVWEVDV